MSLLSQTPVLGCSFASLLWERLKWQAVTHVPLSSEWNRSYLERFIAAV